MRARNWPRIGYLPRVWLCLACGAIIGGCNPRPYVWVQNVPEEHRTAVAAPIRPGDALHIFVRGQEAMSGVQTVGPDGSVVVPTAGRLDLAGLSPADAATKVQERLRGILTEPKVEVAVTQRRPPSIVVTGEVRQPGRHAAEPNDGVLEALSLAGGLTEFAHKDAVFVLREGPPRVRIRFRYRDLASGDPKATEFALRDGDVVVVE